MKKSLWILGLALMLAMNAARLLVAYRALEETERVFDIIPWGDR